jgi:hypothetical protein
MFSHELALISGKAVMTSVQDNTTSSPSEEPGTNNSWSLNICDIQGLHQEILETAVTLWLACELGCTAQVCEAAWQSGYKQSRRTSLSTSETCIGTDPARCSCQ